ncbi:hypothetical protein H4R35_001522 [Dimargaris xerosporica]|nr:hypothetical protein H4R35_001522 [Dimargaris xerosporica]
MLNSLNLPKYLQTLVDPTWQEQQGSQNGQDMTSTKQTPAATDKAPPTDPRAFMNWYWLNIIGGGDVDQLRYYLRDMLAFNVIPGIISQALTSGEHHDKALEIALQISRIPVIERFAKNCRVNALNYFEFIMLYATKNELDGLDTLLPDAQQKGDVNFQFLYNCIRATESTLDLSAWETHFELQPFTDNDSMSVEDRARCTALSSQYNRGFAISKDTVNLYYLDGEDISDLYMPGENDSAMFEVDDEDEDEEEEDGDEVDDGEVEEDADEGTDD